MKVVITHTDFRIYWPARLRALQIYLSAKNIQLEIVEIAGAGSPYYFSKTINKSIKNWHCLFPNRKMEEVSSIEASPLLFEKLDKLSPDIVIAGAIAFPSGATSVRWARMRNKKVIIFDDARIQDISRTKFVDFIKKRIYSCVDAILCPAPAWDETFRYFGFQTNQLFYGIDVIDNHFFKQKSKTTFAKPLPKNYILAVGRQIPKKNFLFLLKCYKNYVLNSNNNISPLVMVGEGSDHAILKTYAKKHNLTSIHFYPFAPQNELREFYQNASLFVLPSNYGETWGLVVNEAMASGLPVFISNQCGCAATLVFEGINGYTFSPDNQAELTKLFLTFERLSSDEQIAMGNQSENIISDWGIERFCIGTYEAIRYAISKSPHCSSLFDKLILKIWKGRYRPV